MCATNSLLKSDITYTSKIERMLEGHKASSLTSNHNSMNKSKRNLTVQLNDIDDMEKNWKNNYVY